MVVGVVIQIALLLHYLEKLVEAWTRGWRCHIVEYELKSHGGTCY